MNAFTRLIYALLIAVAVTIFAGVAVNTVYQPPKSPEYPHQSYSVTPEKDAAAFEQQQKDFDAAYKNHENDMKQYHRNLAAILLPLAVVFTGIGLWLLKRNSEVIGEGLALGGIGTSIYAVITASMTDARVHRLAAVTLLLVSTLLLVRFRFLQVTPKKTKRS